MGPTGARMRTSRPVSSRHLAERRLLDRLGAIGRPLGQRPGHAVALAAALAEDQLLSLFRATAPRSPRPRLHEPWGGSAGIRSSAAPPGGTAGRGPPACGRNGRVHRMPPRTDERRTLADAIGGHGRDAAGGAAHGIERLALGDRGIGTRRRGAEDAMEPQLPLGPVRAWAARTRFGSEFRGSLRRRAACPDGTGSDGGCNGIDQCRPRSGASRHRPARTASNSAARLVVDGAARLARWPLPGARRRHTGPSHRARGGASRRGGRARCRRRHGSAVRSRAAPMPSASALASDCRISGA